MKDDQFEPVFIRHSSLVTNPWMEAGKREGLKEGREEGRQQRGVEMVLRLLSRRLGAVSAIQAQKIRGLALAKIEELGEALLDFTSQEDLVRWLRDHE